MGYNACIGNQKAHSGEQLWWKLRKQAMAPEFFVLCGSKCEGIYSEAFWCDTQRTTFYTKDCGDCQVEMSEEQTRQQETGVGKENEALE